MKGITIKTVLLFLLSFATLKIFAQQEVKKDDVNYNPNATVDSSKKSIKSAAKGNIGQATVVVNYHSPAVRKRVIWGGLVPYNDVWVAGAHSATNLAIDKPFKVEGKSIPAGKYALFAIPGEDEWTVIINKNWQQHLADDYSEKDDLVRIKVKPIKKDSALERLQYFITNSGNNKGTIAMQWEKVRVEFPIEL